MSKASGDTSLRMLESNMPPTSIVIASIWLVFGSAVGLIRFTAEFYRSSQNPTQIGWFVWITLLGVMNIASIITYFLQWPKAYVYYFFSLIFLFFSGMLFFVFFAQSGQQAGAFTAQCVTAALIFTISYLPYRDRFTKK